MFCNIITLRISKAACELLKMWYITLLGIKRLTERKSGADKVLEAISSMSDRDDDHHREDMEKFDRFLELFARKVQH